MTPSEGSSNYDDEPRDAVLTFREQADGRKVSRLPGGKVVLVNLPYLDMVEDGQRWRVRLRHRETFAVADPLERIFEASNPLIDKETADRLRAAIEAEPEPASGDPALDEAPGPENAALDEAPGPEDAAHAEPAAVTPSHPENGPDPAATPQPRTERPGPKPGPERVVRPGDRVAIFVDGANMDGASRGAGYFVDYGKAREFFLASGAFYAAFYYIADFTAQDPLQQRFLDYLSHSGFIIRRKPVKVIRDDETGERFIKGNLDTEIVLDMMNTADNYDLAYLFSGDSDFERAVELLRSRGKRVYVVTSRRSLSRELAYVADKPIFLIEEFQDVLHRDPR